MVAAIGVLLTFYPGWVPIGVVAALVLFAAWLARIPRGALPSIPRWLWFLLLLGGVTAAFAGGSPVIELFGLDLGLGGLLKFLRITALSIVLLALGGMVSWTTNVAEIAPAVAKLGRPLRALRVPVDDWAVDAGFGAARLPDADRRIPHSVRGAQPASQAGAHHAAGPQASMGIGGGRPDRRGRHRGASACRRDGRRDHRTRRCRSDLGGAVGTQTA